MNFNEFLEKEALSFKDTVIFDKEVLIQDGNQTEHLLSIQKYLEKIVNENDFIEAYWIISNGKEVDEVFSKKWNSN